MTSITRSWAIGHAEARSFLGDRKYDDLMAEVGEDTPCRLIVRWEARPGGYFDGLYALREFYEVHGCIIEAETGIGAVRRRALGIPESAWSIESYKWKSWRREHKGITRAAVDPVKLTFKAAWGMR